MSMYVSPIITERPGPNFYHFWLSDVTELIEVVSRFDFKDMPNWEVPLDPWYGYKISHREKLVAIAGGAIVVDWLGYVESIATIEGKTEVAERAAWMRANGYNPYTLAPS